MEPRELVKEEILETKRSASQKLSLGYLHVAVRQKMGMKTRAETDPTLHQGHVSYAGDSGPANATRNRYTHTHTHTHSEERPLHQGLLPNARGPLLSRRAPQFHPHARGTLENFRAKPHLTRTHGVPSSAGGHPTPHLLSFFLCRKLFFNVRCCLRPPSGFSCKKMWMKIK